MQKTRKGFTLVELVVVIAVIAILAGVLIGTFASVINKANESAKVQVLKQQEIEQKATDILNKLENSNWLGWEDFEANVVEALTSVVEKNSTTLTEDQVKQVVEDALASFKASQDATSLTKEQVEAIIENAIGKIEFSGVTEAQVRTIVAASSNNILSTQLTAAQVKSIINAAEANDLTAADVVLAMKNAGITDATDLQTAVDNIVNALNTATSSLAIDDDVKEIKDYLAAADASNVVTAKALNIKLSQNGLSTVSYPYEVVSVVGETILTTTDSTSTILLYIDPESKAPTFVVKSGENYEYKGGLTTTSIKDVDLWTFATEVEEDTTYSTYLLSSYTSTEPIANLTTGLDVGENDEVTGISYIHTGDPQTVVIRTNGGTLVVGTSTTSVATGQIYHYGTLKSATVYTEEDCFHTYGAIGEMNLKAGKVIAEEKSLVYLSTANMGVKLEEKNSGKVFIPSGTTQAEDGTGVPISVAAQINVTPVEENVTLTYTDATKQGGNVYEIGNLSALEQFRDLVNSGFNFDGITVKLTNDITLNDGWTPIGEGSRKAAINTEVGSEGWIYSGNVYKGEFDGNKHKIYNLNNKGYVPSLNCLGKDDSNFIYCYGLFSIVAGNANIHDLELVNVDIDTSRYQSANDNIKGDCVAAVVGFSAGSLTVDNVHVSGNSSIKGYSAVSSIIGKLYEQDGRTTDSIIVVNNCSSNATVEVLTSHYATGLAGHFGGTIDKVTITNNTFTGTIKTLYNKTMCNNAGIAILDGTKFTGENSDNFTHYGNVNDSIQIWKNGTYPANLFLKMSQNTNIETERNVDNPVPQD